MAICSALAPGGRAISLHRPLDTPLHACRQPRYRPGRYSKDMMSLIINPLFTRPLLSSLLATASRCSAGTWCALTPTACPICCLKLPSTAKMANSSPFRATAVHVDASQCGWVAHVVLVYSVVTALIEFPPQPYCCADRCFAPRAHRRMFWI